MKRVFFLFFLLFSNNGFAEDLIRRLLPMTTGATFSPTFTTMNYSVVPEYIRERREIESFIANNMDALRIEVAEGEGEHLDTLGKYYHPADFDKWTAYLQEHFEEIFGSEDNVKSSKEVFNYINRIIIDNLERKKI